MLFGDAIGYAGEERHDSPLHINRDLKMGLLGQKRQAGLPHSKGAPDRIGSATGDKGGAHLHAITNVGKLGKHRKNAGALR
jgi:hypothetical protein